MTFANAAAASIAPKGELGHDARIRCAIVNEMAYSGGGGHTLMNKRSAPPIRPSRSCIPARARRRWGCFPPCSSSVFPQVPGYLAAAFCLYYCVHQFRPVARDIFQDLRHDLMEADHE